MNEFNRKSKVPYSGDQLSMTQNFQEGLEEWRTVLLSKESDGPRLTRIQVG